MLDEFVFSGAGNVALQGKWTAQKLNILLEGAHNVTANDVDIEELKIKLNGVGNLKIGEVFFLLAHDEAKLI